MSIKVELADLGQHLEDFGETGFVLSTGPDRPHIISLRLVLAEGRFSCDPGRSCAHNVEANPALTLLWPAPRGDGHSLIVDGVGQVLAMEGRSRLTITPQNAVLHRPAP